MINKIKNNTFDEVEKEDWALVDFSAEWCGPCKMLAPVMEELSEEMKDQLTFWNADVDHNEELAQRYGIISIPALLLFRNGQKVDMQVGFCPKEEIRSWITSRL